MTKKKNKIHSSMPLNTATESTLSADNKTSLGEGLVEHTFGNWSSLDGDNFVPNESQYPLMLTFKSATGNAGITAEATGHFKPSDIEAVEAYWRQHSLGNTTPWTIGASRNVACEAFIALFPWHNVESLTVCFTHFDAAGLSSHEMRAVSLPLQTAMRSAVALKELQAVNTLCSFIDEAMLTTLRSTLKCLCLAGTQVLQRCSCSIHHFYELLATVSLIRIEVAYQHGRTEQDIMTVLTEASSVEALKIILHDTPAGAKMSQVPDIPLPAHAMVLEKLQHLVVKMASSIDPQFTPLPMILDTPNIKQTLVTPRSLNWLRLSWPSLSKVPLFRLDVTPRYAGIDQHAISTLTYLSSLQVLAIDMTDDGQLGGNLSGAAADAILNEMAKLHHVPYSRLCIDAAAHWPGYSLSALVLARRQASRSHHCPSVVHVCAQNHAFADLVVKLLQGAVPHCKLEAAQ